MNAGISATRILDYFDNPHLAVLVGITAGIKDKKRNKNPRQLGDILVPTATVDVEAGRVTPKGKEKPDRRFQSPEITREPSRRGQDSPRGRKDGSASSKKRH